MRSRRVRRAQRCALVCLLALGLPALAEADRAHEVDFARRRAALELASGRPLAAARVLRTLQPLPHGARAEQEAALLLAEAELLGGNTEAAATLLVPLITVPSEFVRAQAAAHLLGLSAAQADSTAIAAARRFLREADGYDGDQTEAAAPGFLLAARVLRQAGDANGAHRAGERARGVARDVGRLLGAEALLADGESLQAVSAFHALGDGGKNDFSHWVADAARIGEARALLLVGQPERARAALARVQHDPRLRAYAGLFEAQIAYATGDLDAAATALAANDLGAHDPIHAAEAALLAVQIEIDRGRVAAAESLASALVLRLPEPLDVGPGAAPELRFDLAAWHASRTRATLDDLDRGEVMRDRVRPLQLDDEAAVLRFAEPIAADSLAAGLVLFEPHRHEPWPPVAAECRAAARVLAQARMELGMAAEHALRAQALFAERQALLARAAQALAVHRLDLERLQRETLALAAALEAYRHALAAQEGAWLAALQARVDALQVAVAVLERGIERLAARYPDDRSVRSHEETESARSELPAAAGWIARVDSLRAEILPRLAPTVAAVLREREPTSAALALARLQAELETLLAGTAELERDLAAIDAESRAQLAAAESAWREAENARQQASLTLAKARTALDSEESARLRARQASYAEAARDAEATAAFARAMDETSGSDAERLVRLQHAAMLLESLATELPHALRADETLFRLGVVHVQRASLEHRQALSAFLEAGDAAAAVPLPVESYAEALAAYARLVEQHPDSPRVPDAHFHMGFLFGDIGSPEVSAEHLQAFLARAAADDARRGRAALRLGEDYVLLGRIEHAFEAYDLAARTGTADTRAMALFELAWCAYELDRYDAGRTALRQLLAPETAAALDLQAEGLELLALCFAADHAAPDAARELDAWGAPPYALAVLRRMAQLFTSRAQYDEAIAAWQTILERDPHHPYAAGAAVELVQLVELRHGDAAAHARAATLAPHFAPGGDWARAVASGGAPAGIDAAWQSRLIEEDRARARADSVAQALADPAAAAAHMSRMLRSAAVFAHRRAATDSLAAKEHLEDAVQLYRQNLELFPGADGEPTTWLYLGEALYVLERPVEAADAYETAAAHPAADSTTQVQATMSMLAALDGAAASDAGLLPRYERAARGVLQARPGDAHGLDALERVGALAFAAARFEQAEAAYTDLAAQSPPQRAAPALKIVGDTWWRRDDPGKAADAYARALVPARTSANDSLVAVLEVLVPGALFRVATDAEARGDADKAAAAFEHVASEHPGFASTDQALYRAAHLRASRGDTTAACANYDRLVRALPHSPLHADAWLELAALRAARGEHLPAAAAYAQFASTYAQHAQANPARLRAAELHTAGGDTLAADAAYANLLTTLTPTTAADTALVAQLWLRRARLSHAAPEAAAHYAQALEWQWALSAEERAEANFHCAEALRPRYENLALNAPLVESLGRKKEALEDVLAAYAPALRANVQPWHAAACLRVGDCLSHLGLALLDSPPPPELQDADLDAYRAALAQQADALESRAVDTWTAGLGAARTSGTEDTWVRGLRVRLFPVLARRVQTRAAPLFVHAAE